MNKLWKRLKHLQLSWEAVPSVWEYSLYILLHIIQGQSSAWDS